MRRLLILIMLLAPIALAQASDPTEELNRKYAKHILRLQTPLQGDSISFDLEGRPKGKPGLVGLDDPINIDEIKIKNNELIIEGTRALLIMSPVDGAVRYGTTTKKVRLTLALPMSTVKAAEVAFANVFLAAGSGSCTTEEAADFAARATGNAKAERPASDGPIQVCIPSGGRGFWGGKGVTPPQMIEHGAPVFPARDAFSKLSRSRKIKLFILVDEQGMPRDVVIVSGRDAREMYDRIAVRDWRYRPAKKDGIPVPVVSSVEVELNTKVERY